MVWRIDGFKRYKTQRANWVRGYYSCCSHRNAETTQIDMRYAGINALKLQSGWMVGRRQGLLNILAYGIIFLTQCPLIQSVGVIENLFWCKFSSFSKKETRTWRDWPYEYISMPSKCPNNLGIDDNPRFVGSWWSAPNAFIQLLASLQDACYDIFILHFDVGGS